MEIFEKKYVHLSPELRVFYPCFTSKNTFSQGPPDIFPFLEAEVKLPLFFTEYHSMKTFLLS
jgi:hypothetical protein